MAIAADIARADQMPRPKSHESSLCKNRPGTANLAKLGFDTIPRLLKLSVALNVLRVPAAPVSPILRMLFQPAPLSVALSVAII
jgi:hypothetical protein